MRFTLGPQAKRAGFRLTAFDEIGSTNAEAMALGRAREPGPLWVVSKRQTAGRGRRGKAWLTPQGNLAASLLRMVDLPPSGAATIGFVAGLALARALQAVAQPPTSGRFRLKWPNDVLADGAKLAGILLETETLDRDARIIVVGLGVNVVAAPDDVPYPATSLAALGYDVTAEHLFRALSDSWVEMEAVWNRGVGMAQIRRQWLASAAGIGAPVAVRVGEAVAEGVFETIDDSGQLIVRRPDGSRRAIAAGEVHFDLAATARAEA